MLKKEFIENLKLVVNGSRNVFNNKSVIRQLFCEMLDSYSKNGLITDAQAKNWILTDLELNKIIKNKG